MSLETQSEHSPSEHGLGDPDINIKYRVCLQPCIQGSTVLNFNFEILRFVQNLGIGARHILNTQEIKLGVKENHWNSIANAVGRYKRLFLSK